MPAPRFIFLGTGTSGGIPLIACDCPVCTSPDPRDRRTRCGACIRWIDPSGLERTVLIDVTPDLRMQAIREDLWRCDAILFTHNHVDHIFGLDEVRRFNAVMKAPIDIYAERSVLDSLRRVYKHIFEAAANINDSFVATLIAHEIPAPPVEGGAAPAIDLWGLRFIPIRLLHGRLPILGYRVELDAGKWPDAAPAEDHTETPTRRTTPPSPLPLAYCTDTSAVPNHTWPHLRGLRTLVLDALRHRHHPTHLTLEQAVNLAQRIQAEQTYFIHMAHELGHAQTEADLPDNIRLAHDGLALGEPIPTHLAWRPKGKVSLPAGGQRFEEG